MAAGSNGSLLCPAFGCIWKKRAAHPSSKTRKNLQNASINKWFPFLKQRVESFESYFSFFIIIIKYYLRFCYRCRACYYFLPCPGKVLGWLAAQSATHGVALILITATQTKTERTARLLKVSRFHTTTSTFFPLEGISQRYNRERRREREAKEEAARSFVSQQLLLLSFSTSLSTSSCAEGDKGTLNKNKIWRNQFSRKDEWNDESFAPVSILVLRSSIPSSGSSCFTRP